MRISKGRNALTPAKVRAEGEHIVLDTERYEHKTFLNARPYGLAEESELGRSALNNPQYHT